MQIPSNMNAAAVLLLLAGTTALAAHWDVNVGKGGQLRFEPEEIIARAGDTITYHFFSKNHAVAESSFDNPCQYLDDGIFSGYVPTPSDSVASATTFTIIVEDDSRPIWLYCPQTIATHCQNGMVHSINAPRDGFDDDSDGFPNSKTLAAYREKAKTAPPSTNREDLLPFGGLRAVDVQVGSGADFVFVPNDIIEPVGTVVRFNFNPRNHTVTESSFAAPCRQLDGGFSSGFIPTSVSPSGAVFELLVEDDEPAWFFCAQGNHCTAGMVGSVNAPVEGEKTLAAYVDSSKKVTVPSTIAPKAPLGGVLFVNGTEIPSLDGNVLVPVDNGNQHAPATAPATAPVPAPAPSRPDGHSDWVAWVPKPGELDQYVLGQAGGSPIANYSWPETLDQDVVDLLSLGKFLDDILLSALTAGLDKLSDGGSWAGVYPTRIVQSLSAMKAQLWVQRSVATDTLQHFDKPVPGPCKYRLPTDAVDNWLAAVGTLLNLHIGMTAGALTLVAPTDPWLVSPMATSLGSVARMSGVVSMMLNRLASATPREAAVPPGFVYAYAFDNYVESCPDEYPWKNPASPLAVTEERMAAPGSRRVKAVTLAMTPEMSAAGKLHVAWLGAWGEILFTPLGADGRTDVPEGLYGDVWAIATTDSHATMRTLKENAVAGPAPIWVGEP